MNELVLMRDMSDMQKMMFQSEMNRRRKNYTTALLLCLFLGQFGAQHFYFGETGKGIASFLFWWTFIPLVIAIVDLFTMRKRVERYNAEQANEAAIQVRALLTA